MKTLTACLVVGSIAANGQSLRDWQEIKKTDPLRDTSYLQFELEGKFLSAPRHGNETTPKLVVQCLPEEHSVGYRVSTNGHLLASYVFVGAVLDAQVNGVVGKYRLDDKSIQTELWSHSTDISAAFFPEATLNNLIYGHVLRHTENSSPPVRKVVVAVNEYLAAEVVMQFDLPNPDKMAHACGLILHKRKK